MMTLREENLIYRLRKRADIRRQIPTRKSVQEGEPDRIADLLEEAANMLESLEKSLAELKQNCKTHPDAPHGFCRNASLSEDRYVCECEFWEPPQPEQEPFAWMFEDDYQRMKTSETSCEVYSVKVGSPERGETEIELYTTPPQRQWVGLTDDETMLLANETSGQHWMCEAHIQRFRAAIEAKLKEKNT